jgi:multidrug efflux pump
VIPQVRRRYRVLAQQLKHYYLNTRDGVPVPVSTFVSLKKTVEPEQLKRFQQLNSATLSAVLAPGTSIGEGLGFLQQKSREIFPKGYTADYAGESRQYQQEGTALLVTFFFSIIIIYLVLAAQFESFRDPLIMLVSVPMSVCGALLFLSLGLASLNIYTQVGLITLIGLISKHGILIVQFANQMQQEGMSKREAIEEAASVRLRPILMTTGAMVLGVVPLLLASGAGAVSRFDIGLVIFTGMSIGTVFTLFIVPTVYMLLAKTHSQEKQV